MKSLPYVTIVFSWCIFRGSKLLKGCYWFRKVMENQSPSHCYRPITLLFPTGNFKRNCSTYSFGWHRFEGVYNLVDRSVEGLTVFIYPLTHPRNAKSASDESMPLPLNSPCCASFLPFSHVAFAHLLYWPFDHYINCIDYYHKLHLKIKILHR